MSNGRDDPDGAQGGGHTVKISCRHCGQHLEFDDDMAGMVIDCPSCGVEVRAPEETEPVDWRALGRRRFTWRGAVKTLVRVAAAIVCLYVLCHVGHYIWLHTKLKPRAIEQLARGDNPRDALWKLSRIAGRGSDLDKFRYRQVLLALGNAVPPESLRLVAESCAWGRAPDSGGVRKESEVWVRFRLENVDHADIQVDDTRFLIISRKKGMRWPTIPLAAGRGKRNVVLRKGDCVRGAVAFETLGDSPEELQFNDATVFVSAPIDSSEPRSNYSITKPSGDAYPLGGGFVVFPIPDE